MISFRPLFVVALLVASPGRVLADDDDDDDGHEGDPLLQVGSRDRFWRHHVTEESLVHGDDGVNHYGNIQQCLRDKLTPQERDALKKERAARGIGTKIAAADDGDSTVLVVVKNAMLPVHAKAVQSLAACARQFLPSLYESRAMYKEFDLDEDPGLGGNCPTHLAPLVSVFLPEVADEMQRTLEVAYEGAGWSSIVAQERKLGLSRTDTLPEPKDVGFRASEHLTYTDFPLLAPHHDGSATAYTVNFAFSGPDDYDGGEFYINTGDMSEEGEDDEKIRRYLKPEKYDALVFLGGRYMHGVSQITGGHREMFSSELWAYPDIPFGGTLWTSTPENMEEYIELCNKEIEQGNHGPCKAAVASKTAFGTSVDDARNKNEGADRDDDDEEDRPNRIRPEPLVPIRFRDAQGKEYDLTSFLPEEEEPDFLVPTKLEPGEMIPLRWRDTLAPVDGSDGESLVIGFPPELRMEFQAYVERTGMMEVARKMLYEEKPLKAGEHRLYTLDDGTKWGGMVQGDWDTDMIWLDPADEECFESLLAMLGRGGFDVVLDKVGKAFDLNGLMVQGVGAIFLSQYEVSDNLHIDIPDSWGSFYNIIVPVHIPVNNTAKFYVADTDEAGRKGTVTLNPDVGVVLGGESYHGTGECNYRETNDFRLSFAVYVADINEENVDLIASDSTSLWPTDGDTDWFWAQQGRLWSKAGDRSLKNDKGRKPLKVEDKHDDCPNSKHLCESDPQGMRLNCPKTCKLYLEEDVYYSKLADRMMQCPGESHVDKKK